MISDRCENLKVTIIGGGTGLSVLLRGIKKFTEDITAIVTVGDDGGGSGILRKDLGMLPPGDIRNCILALADTEPIMEKLLRYRFKDGNLKGQSFGNLFLAAMTGISNDNFLDAIEKMSDVLAVKGKVLPVTLDNMILEAELFDGTIVAGESKIPERSQENRSGIKKLKIKPEMAKAPEAAVESIMDSDIIVIGPGSLYTSIIPNILVGDIKDALMRTKARKVYISNVMTQPGETDRYRVSDHIRALEDHSYPNIIDYIIANNGEITEEARNRYAAKESHKVELDLENLKGYEVISENIIRYSDDFVKHNSDRLAEIIFENFKKIG